MQYAVKSKDRTQAVYFENSTGNYYTKYEGKQGKLELYTTDNRDDAISVWMMCGGAYGDYEVVEV